MRVNRGGYGSALWHHGRMSRRVVIASLAVLAACGKDPQRPVPHAYLFEKGRYQAIYAPNGRLLRLLYDADGDRVADVVTLYGPTGQPRRVEVDGDGDGVVDRWELRDEPEGRVRVGLARHVPGVPDLWEHKDTAGRVVRRELDENGDGRTDRDETYARGGLTGVSLDSDADGRMDRWQEWRAGTLAREDLDTNGDGEPDRRLYYTARGTLRRMQKLGVTPP